MLFPTFGASAAITFFSKLSNPDLPVCREEGEKVADEEEEEEAYFIHGLFMEGARWNAEEVCLDDLFSTRCVEAVPPIKLLPCLESEKKQSDAKTYFCPVYKTARRAGTLSTTGR